MPRKTFERRAPQERRGAILEAARLILESKDFYEIRMEEVARRAGVAKGTIYLYFPTKEKLFGALMRDLCERTKESWERLAASAEPGEARLRAIVRAQLDFFRQNRTFFLQVLQGTLCPSGDGAPKRAELIRYNITLMKDAFAEGVRRGQFRRVDPESAAIALFGLIRGFVIAVIIGEMPDRLLDSEGVIWDVFCRGVRR